MTALPHWRIAEGGDSRSLDDGTNWSSVWWDGEGLHISLNDDLDRPLIRLVFERGAMFDVAPHEKLIVASTHKDDVPPQTVAYLLADQVEPRVLAYEGAFIVHASAVEVEGSIALFLGDSGVGKSTLAASFDQSGIPMLCDDAVIIDMVDGEFTGRAVYPSLRLHPDSFEALVPTLGPSDAVAYHGEKRRLALPFQDRWTGASLPIAAIFSMKQTMAKEIEIESVSPADICMALVTNSFALNPTDLAQASRKLRDAGLIADRIPAFSLDYPRDFHLLPTVRAAILDTVCSTIVGSR